MGIILSGLIIFHKFPSYQSLNENSAEIISILAQSYALSFLAIVFYKVIKSSRQDLGILGDYKEHLLLGTTWLLWSMGMGLFGYLNP